MTPLPGALGGKGPLIAWRLDDARHAATWDSGEGPFRTAGRWNPRGLRMIYATLDPATAILEVAVHKGFDTLDRVPHVVTSFAVADVAGVHVVHPGDLPNPRWLQSAQASPGQRAWGAEMMQAHPAVVLPSVVSQRSWNLILGVRAGAARLRLQTQERLSLDTRLPPVVA